MKVIPPLLFFLLLSFPLRGQIDEDVLDVNILSPDSYCLEWDGKDGRTYFIQCADELEEWIFEPTILSGEGSPLESIITTDADKMFFRLLATDADDGGDPETADFDDDGLTALQEITNQPQSNPLDEDTDADGINDLAEYLIIHYSATDEYDSPDDFSGEDDLDNDGLTTAEEVSFEGIYNPLLADSDGDNVLDGAEDFDGDGVSNQVEFANGTNPSIEDSEPTGEDAYLSAIEDFQDANYTLVPLPETLSAGDHSTIKSITALDDGGIAYFNKDENKLYYWYNGTLKSAANSATNSGHVYFTKNGHGIPAVNFANILNSSQYYKLKDGDITTVSIPALSDEALEAHTTSLFKIYKKEALENYGRVYEFDSMEATTDFGSRLVHMFDDGGGIYVHARRYSVSFHYPSPSTYNPSRVISSTTTLTPVMYYYKKGGTEIYSDFYTDGVTGKYDIDYKFSGGKASDPIIMFEHNDNYVIRRIFDDDPNSEAILEADASFLAYWNDDEIGRGNILTSNQGHV